MNIFPSQKKKKKKKNMPQASPAPVPEQFPDGAVASAMLLWAEDVDVPLDTARQAVQHVHAQHMAQITQYGTASHVALFFFFFFWEGKIFITQVQ